MPIANVRDLISKEEFKTKVHDAISPTIQKDISDMFPKLPKSYFIMQKWWYWCLLILTCWLLIPVFWHYFQRSKQRNILLEEVNISKILEAAMNQITELKFDDLTSNANYQNLYSFRVASIPPDARVTKASKLVKFKLLDKYPAEARTGNMYWVRYIGRTETVYNLPTGYILIDAMDAWPTYNYQLSHHKFLSKSMELESPFFNKEFSFQANDPVKARMQFTPLAMEEMIKHKKLIFTNWWEVQKNGRFLVIKFAPKNWNQLSFFINFKSTSPETIAEEITQDIVNDLYYIYSLLGLVLIPIML